MRTLCLLALSLFCLTACSTQRYEYWGGGSVTIEITEADGSVLGHTIEGLDEAGLEALHDGDDTLNGSYFSSWNLDPYGAVVLTEAAYFEALRELGLGELADLREIGGLRLSSLALDEVLAYEHLVVFGDITPVELPDGEPDTLPLEGTYSAPLVLCRARPVADYDCEEEPDVLQLELSWSFDEDVYLKAKETTDSISGGGAVPSFE